MGILHGTMGILLRKVESVLKCPKVGKVLKCSKVRKVVKGFRFTSHLFTTSQL